MVDEESAEGPPADADEEDDEGGGGAPAVEQKKISGKSIVLIAAPVLLVLIGGGVAFFLGVFDSLFGEEELIEEDEIELTQEVVFYDLPEMLVNIKASGRQQSFLKVRVALELDRVDAVVQLEQLLPRIIDNFQVYLRELRAEDLTGSAGMFRVKEELLTRVNAAVAPVRVNDILFKEILIQ